MTKRRDWHSIQGLIDVFAESRMEQDRQLALGKAGNAAAKRVSTAFTRLCYLYGDTGREALMALLSHPRDRVRVLAAAYLLRYSTDRAMHALEEIAANGRGFEQIEAFYCMKHWQEGTWRLDLAPEPATDEEANREEGPHEQDT